MKLPSIQSQALKIILLPLTILSLLLCSSLIYLHTSYANKLLIQHGHAQIKHWAQIVEKIGSKNTEELSALLDTAREEPDVRGMAIFSTDNKKHLHLGPPFDSPIQSSDKTASSSGTYKLTHSNQALLFQTTLSDNSKLYIELSKLPYLLLNFKILLSGFVLWLLSCIIAALLASRCSRQVVLSLSQINNNINSIASGDLNTNSNSEIQTNHELSSIMTSIGHMRDSLLQNHADNKHYMDQSTEDLRQTLDTIEVQNIELNIERKKALEASRIKSEFLANTSHEFRTPLNGIIGFTQLALRTELSDQQHTYLRTILDSSQNLLTSINDILDFSKLETGQLSLDYHPVNPRSCIEETLKILAPVAQEKKLELITLLDPELPENLLGDPLRLKQILSNLIGNAVKFSENGNIIIRAQAIAAHNTHVDIKISISDSGIGLSQEQQQELFSPFSQADTSNAREYGGTGLGLSICKGLIERMEGEIGVDSELGQGSTFWIKVKLGIDRSCAEYSRTERLSTSSERALIFSQNSMSRLQLHDLFETWKLSSDDQSTIEHLLPDIKKANTTGKPYDLLIIDSNFNLKYDDYQHLKKVIWQASQRYQCRIVILACSEQYSLMVDDTLQKLTRCCLKPLITKELREQLVANISIDNKNSALTTPLDLDIAEKPSELPALSAEPPHILVVDDNPANLQLATELLRGIGAKVSGADNGSEALQQCEEDDFDLIFMDVQMPVLDGMETTKELRLRQGSEKRTPVIALTAHAMSDQKTKLLLAGMDDYLHKPVSESQLRHAISRWSPNKTTTNSSAAPKRREREHLGTIDNVKDALVVDRCLCLTLANHKPDLARDMLTMLISAAKNDLEQLPTLHQQKHFEDLSERVHKLYGSSCYSGVPALKTISGKLDKALQKESYSDITPLLDELYYEINKLLEWSEEFDIDVLFECE